MSTKEKIPPPKHSPFVFPKRNKLWDPPNATFAQEIAGLIKGIPLFLGLIYGLRNPLPTRVASWYHLHLYNPFQYFRVKMKAFRLGFSPTRKKTTKNPAGLTNASHERGLSNRIPRLTLWGTVPWYTTLPQHNSIHWQVPFKISPVESPGISAGISRFPGFPLRIWIGVAGDLVLNTPWSSCHGAGGQLDGTGDMKGSGWFGNDDYCLQFFYIWCAHIYIYMIFIMHIQILHIYVLYIVVNIFI